MLLKIVITNVYIKLAIPFILAGFSTKSLISKVKCEECRQFLNSEGVEINWIQLKEEVLAIIRHCEANLKHSLNNKNILKPNFFNTIVTKSITSFPIDKHFNQLKFHSQDHRYTIVQSLSQKYITSRIKHFLKNLNIEKTKVSLRKRMTTLIHFSNQ